MAAFTCNRRAFTDKADFIKRGRGCATIKPNHTQIDRIDNAIRAFRRSRRARIGDIRINVQFIHITDGKEGKIRENQRVDQISVMNSTFNPHGIYFDCKLESVIEVDRPEWFYMDHGSAEEREAKMALHVAPETNLNFYTGGLEAGLLGWATFPFELEGNRIMDGVVMLHSTLPGGNAAPYNLGMTAVHEVGHWLGLYHTFQGGCDAFGDHVNDTAAHSGPNYGGPDEWVNNACNPNETAPFENYMNYVDDAHMNHFTDEQGRRMKDQVGTYRSDFIV